MRCHYEVLGLARAADAGEVKKAFRLLALRWHPDKHQKNGVSPEEATLRFQEIQNAYEVLSDPHERKWYDEHREQVLRGGDGAGDAGPEDELDLFRYFSASVYSGFGSDDKSFYSVYGALFAKIDGLDAEDDAAQRLAPAFGAGDASADEVAGFYQYWRSYVTRRSFAWADEYKTTDAPTRQVRRAMEKENRKLREAAKKAFTADVRELVEFVYRRDKRVLALQKHREREREQRRREEEERRRERQVAFDAERLAFQQQERERWDSHATSRVADQHIADEMEQLRRRLDADVLVCDLCRKTFKSPKQLENHVTSKKHRERELELGVSADFDLLEEEMERELREELAAAGKLKISDDGDDDAVETPASSESPATEDEPEGGSPERTLIEEEQERKRLEAEQLRLEKEQKAAEKRKERKEKRKEKKKEGVDKIVSMAARAKQAEEDEDGGRGRGRGKKGRKARG